LPRRLLSYFELLEMSDKRMMTMAGLPREVLRTRNVADKKEWLIFDPLVAASNSSRDVF